MTMKRSTEGGAAARAASSSAAETNITRAPLSSQMKRISGGAAAGPMVAAATPASAMPQTISMYSRQLAERTAARSPWRRPSPACTRLATRPMRSTSLA